MSDSGKIITQCGSIKLVLDLLEVDDRTASVRVGFEVLYSSHRQELIYRRSGSWVEYSEIDALASALRKGSSACLRDLSEYPVVEIKSSESGSWLYLNPQSLRESKEAEEMRLEIAIEPFFSQKLSEAIYAFPRWW